MRASLQASGRAAAAGAVSAVVFALYRATLLPGLDFGDSASFQFRVASSIITPRDGYPLYYAIGRLFFHWSCLDPARALNVASAVEGALACAILMLAAAELSGSLIAGLASALLFAGSYTFWSQSIISEVYALHMVFVSLTLWLLLLWEARPGLGRLAVFFAVYALAFGNHLSMILLAPAFTVFLLIAAPGGWRAMVTPKIVLLAVALGTAGATQYAWNLRALWLGPFPPSGLADALRASWFDITKSDWRETLVLHVPGSMLRDRVSMYLFDLRQQFGVIGIGAALLGIVHLTAMHRRRALLAGLAYLVNAAFAFGYNVGDTHVFYLPSHLIVALLAAPGTVFAGEIAARLLRSRTPLLLTDLSWNRGWMRRGAPAPRSSVGRDPEGSRYIRAMGTAAAFLLIGYGAVRMYRDYPALDRSGDRRPIEVLRALTTGLDDRHAILLTDLDWQVANGLAYFEQQVRPQVVSARMTDVLLYAPALVHDNLDIGRQVAVTRRARDSLMRTHGPLLPTRPDPRVAVSGLGEMADGLAAGTPYVLCVLKPTREFALDRNEVTRLVAKLIEDASPVLPDADYVALAGRIGEPPLLIAAADRPFRRAVTLGRIPVEVRMESWLAMDTIRRMGFGHVTAGRRHALIVERGVSFVAFSEAGDPLRSGYASSIFATEPRYLCYR